MKKPNPLINWTPALYDRLSKHYDRLSNWLFPIGDRGRQKVTADLESGLILDIACGTGTLLQNAYQSGLRPFGLDTSRGMLQQTRAKVPSADLVQASFYALPFPVGSFDYVVETNAVSGADIAADTVLSEMLRVCQRGGEIRISDYGKSPRTGFWIQLLERIGILIGDYPHDFPSLFRTLGYKVENETLGWAGMYQYIRVRKDRSI